jgi:nicotinamidase-related amidase
MKVTGPASALMSPDPSNDLHGNVPDSAPTCLLVIDMINEFSFPDADAMFPAIIGMAERIAQLKRRVKMAGFPVIYVNDNFGRWQSDFRKLVTRCLEDPYRGKEVAKLLHPEEDDYFVLKPKHSGFYATPLELLLTYLKARRLIITGVAGNSCVLHTAADAYMREFELVVPADCVLSTDARANAAALEHMKTMLKAGIRTSSTLTLGKRPF